MRRVLLFACALAFLPLAAKQTIVLELYNDKGLMGKQVTEVTNDNALTSTTELSWNNRRLTLEESYELNDKGYPVKVTVTGISAFGAPVQELFSVKDGIATWATRADDGRASIADNQFYVAVDGMNNAALVRALLKAPFNQIELFPQGNASLTKVKSKTLTNNGEQQVVHLYAISGMNLTPQFLWFDDQGYLFALNAGFVRGIRSGWSMETFAQLKAISEKAEQEYFADLSKSLTTPISEPVIIRNANVVDFKTNQVLSNTDVVIKDAKIAAIGKNLAKPAKARVIDAKGQTLIPGLWDMHGHLSKTDGFNYLAAGVTSVRDIGNSPSNMEDIEKLYRQSYLGTRIYKAGFIDKQSDYSAGNGITVATLQEAKDAVDWYADRGYIQIKTYSSMDPSWMKELAEHIHKRGLRLSGHIPAFMSAEQAVKAGFDEIQHINMLFLNFLGGDKIDTRQRLRFTLIGEQAKDLDLNSDEVNQFIALLAEKGIEVDLTVSTFNSLLLTRDKQVDPEYAAIAEHLPPLFQRGLKTATMKIDSAEQDASYRAGAAALLTMTKKLYDAGVPIIPGTDAFTGFTLLRELELYSMAGIPNIEVLKIGSLNSARVVGQADSTGSIEVGKVADLVLIDGDPTKNMSDLRKASLVIQGDRMFQPEKIYQSMGVKPFAPAVQL
ncbi:MAG: amidohydrolase family protein [Gammaproteobacteria bacterium]|nr:amidohydrolase family protein [Gammaproteobacteria bacterium]